jgi:intein/homing endonuclease
MNTVEKEKWYLGLILDAYANGRSMAYVSKKYGINYEALGKVKRKNNVKTKLFSCHNKRINDNIELEMIKMYKKGKSSNFIAKQFGFKTRNTVLQVLNKHGVKTKKGISDYTKYNADVFKKIDSHDKAYILGLIYTDGYIYKDYRGVCIQLTESDRYLLEKIADFFGESSSVISINCESKRKIMAGAKDMARLGVYCPAIAEDLKKHGVLKNKTYNLSLDAKIPKRYLYSFLRGIIDGDGTLGIAKTKNIWCNISTRSEKFAKDICSLDIPDKFVRTCNPAGQWTVRLSGGNEATKSFLKKIYKNKGSLYLKRKYAKIKSQIR